MKKLGTALCFSSVLLACAPVQAGWQGNWLLGASGGYSDREGDLQITQFTLGQSVERRGFTDIGWLLGVFGGYQLTCNKWLLGAELNIDWYNLSQDNDHDLAFSDASVAALPTLGWSANFTYKRDWVVGLTGRLGYEVAPYLLPYVRLGLEWSDDKLTYNEASNVGGFAGSIDGRQDAIRLVTGLGIEVPMPRVECLTIRAEYDFHARGKRVDADGSVGPFPINVNRKPYVQTGIVSVVWNI